MSFDFNWKPNTITYDNKRRVFFESVKFNDVKLFIAYDHGILEGIYSTDGQDITEIVSEACYAAFEEHVHAGAEA